MAGSHTQSVTSNHSTGNVTFIRVNCFGGKHYQRLCFVFISCLTQACVITKNIRLNVSTSTEPIIVFSFEPMSKIIFSFDSRCIRPRLSVKDNSDSFGSNNTAYCLTNFGGFNKM